MKGLCTVLAATSVVLATGCQAKEPPTQVVYRFDDHRFLELKGWGCEGELWYTDTFRGIHTRPVSQFYRIFTKKFVHPSERYIAIPTWDDPGTMISKDYGKTWSPQFFSVGPNEPDGTNQPSYEDIISFTVVNDQGFLQTKHRLYMSSKPFEDPRILPGGPGIAYTVDDGMGNKVSDTLDPRFPGWAWGMVYMTKQGLKHSTQQFKANWQDLPDSVPEVKEYTGWDHMRCDMDAGR
ncbi:T6SS immunity protein Tli3 family protein [Enterobacter cloacae complex sp. BZL2001]|uniref:T6SS immunity protein Tli3 family protein n=1 Tax=Enterobacter cloacae complex sp. BZL2001 TaxID=3412323 RepID=UPI003BA64BE7